MYGIEQHFSNFSFGDGLAPFRASNGLYGYIDNTGMVTLPAKYLAAGPFRNGVAAVGLSVDQSGDYLEIGFIDKNGLVGVRNADLYPIKDSASEPIRMPKYYNDQCVLRTFYERPGITDKDGNTIPGDYRYYQTSTNADGLAVSISEFPIGSGNFRQFVTDSNKSLVNVLVGGQPTYQLDMGIDNERQSISAAEFPDDQIEFGFTNLLSSGFYVIDDPNPDPTTDPKFRFARYDAGQSKIMADSDPYAVYSASNFFDGHALVFKNNDFHIIDNTFATQMTIPNPWDETAVIMIRYIPENRYVPVCAVFESELKSCYNLYDLVDRKWILAKDIISQSFLQFLSYVSDPLFFYVEDDSHRGLKAINFQNPSLESPPMITATRPHDDFFSAEVAPGVCGYLNYDMKLIFAFNFR